jgi:hypothetical protein
MTGDDWNKVMFAAADGTSRAAVIFFCAVIIVGESVCARPRSWLSGRAVLGGQART